MSYLESTEDPVVRTNGVYLLQRRSTECRSLQSMNFFISMPNHARKSFAYSARLVYLYSVGASRAKQASAPAAGSLALCGGEVQREIYIRTPEVIFFLLLLPWFV